ncbi:hypothetical protein BDZ97DRAFT_1133500 [Flammula alnicola]|nr:hypothetical protein BDZ97DRAFT_1133500 [Flammula alnicola]
MSGSPLQGKQGKTSPFIPQGPREDRGPEVHVSPEVLPETFSSEVRRKYGMADERRKKRNDERKQHRDRGQKDVSDDEDDVLLSALVEVGKHDEGERVRSAQAMGTATMASSVELSEGIPEPSAAYKEPLLIEDQQAEGNVLSEHDNSIPDCIPLLVKCKRTPPLSLFLGESLDRIKGGRDIKYIKVGIGEHANTKILDVSTFPLDCTLTEIQWSQAYNTFLNFISSTVGERLYSGFVSHFDNMLSDQDFSRYFPAYRQFDEKLRQRFFTKPFLIDSKSSEYHSMVQNAKLANLSLPTAAGRSMPANRWHPYPQGNFQRPFRARPGFKTRCLRCGSEDGHRANICRAEQPSRAGRSFVVRAAGQGLERTSDGRAVCIRFNLGYCSISDSSHPLHICSLCADPHHAATACTRN